MDEKKQPKPSAWCAVEGVMWVSGFPLTAEAMVLDLFVGGNAQELAEAMATRYRMLGRRNPWRGYSQVKVVAK